MGKDPKTKGRDLAILPIKGSEEDAVTLIDLIRGLPNIVEKEHPTYWGEAGGVILEDEGKGGRKVILPIVEDFVNPL